MSFFSSKSSIRGGGTYCVVGGAGAEVGVAVWRGVGVGAFEFIFGVPAVGIAGVSVGVTTEAGVGVGVGAGFAAGVDGPASFTSVLGFGLILVMRNENFTP